MMFKRLMRSFWLKCVLFAAIVFFLLFVFRVPILQGVASYLVVSAPLDSADVMVVLGGDGGERVYYAAQLFKQGYAPKMILSGGALAWRLTYAQNMRDEARYFGVPPKAIIVEDQSRSTWENAKFVLPIIEKAKYQSFLLVTSPYHMRRSLLVFNKVFKGKGIKIVPAPAVSCKYTQYNPHRWWTQHEDTGFVVLEYIKLIEYAWKGYI